ncbi:MAG: response regulator transcription factor [Acidimicrobiales bacterium]
MAYQLLVVEDDPVIGEGLARALASEGYGVQWARSAHDALDLAAAAPPDLVLLDLGLPDLDGVELCRRLRTDHPAATIVMLTARVEEVDVVVGLDAGGDDYVTKPFRRAELLARVRAHLRRATVTELERIDAGPLMIDIAARRAELAGAELELTPKEFDLLALLAAEAGRVVTRERIMAEVWDEHWFGPTKTLDMHVSSLRKKLAAAGELITTLRGVGYRFERR